MKKTFIILVVIKLIVLICIISHCNSKYDDLNLIGKNINVYIEGKAIVLNSEVLEYKKNTFLKLKHNNSKKKLMHDSKSRENNSYVYINFDKVKYYRILIIGEKKK